MIVENLTVGPLQANCYIAASEQTGAGVIVDPGGDAELIRHAIRSRKANIEWILLTHAHFDHVGALNGVRRAVAAPVAMHRAELPNLREAARAASLLGLHIEQPADPERFLQDGETVDGKGYSVQVVHTPGHTTGGVCFYVDDVLFSGDTVLASSVGRTDFPGGSHSQLIDSIRSKILTLPSETRILPGHGPATTVGDEKILNPFL